MYDDLDNGGEADRGCIKVKEPHQVVYGANTRGVTGDQLRAAVPRVGVMAAEAQKHLDEQLV